jgi:hypothetical protein
VDAHESEQLNTAVEVVTGGTTSLQARGGALTAASIDSGLRRGMSNEQLAHEILLDPNFHLRERGCIPNDALVYGTLRETYVRAFWESLEDDLTSDPVSYSRIINVVKEIKEETLNFFVVGP